MESLSNARILAVILWLYTRLHPGASFTTVYWTRWLTEEAFMELVWICVYSLSDILY
jgi:hypothetical protein